MYIYYSRGPRDKARGRPDSRVISSATHRKIGREVAEKRFKEIEAIQSWKQPPDPIFQETLVPTLVRKTLNLK